MSRFDVQTNQAPPVDAAGDGVFIGLNAKLPPEQLPQGYCSRLENKRLYHGAVTREGTRTPLFANMFVAQSYIGSGIYSNPNGVELGLVATNKSSVAGIRSGTAPLSIPVTGEFVNGVTIEFAQHFDKALAHQSDASGDTFIWDGLDTGDGFVPIPEPDPDLLELGFAKIPNPPWSINYLGRAWFPIPGSPDTIGASDINDPTTYDAILHSFRVNTGTADAIVGIYPYLSNNLIIGKHRSIDIMQDIPGDLGDSFLLSLELGLSPSSPGPPRIAQISDQIGILARKSGLLVAGRFMFLSQAGKGGIYQITTDQHGNYIVDQTPVSDPIQPIIQRINWSRAHNAVAQLDGIYAYWAVPIDSCQYNNAMLVLNIATGQWESLDLWNATPRNLGRGRILTTDNPMRMDNLIRMNYYGTNRLFAFNHAQPLVHLLYQGTDDQLGLAQGQGHLEQRTYPIQDVFVSRGYSFGNTERESKNVSIALATFAPSITIDQIIDGSNGDELPLSETPIARSRTQYEVDKPDYALSNVHDDAEVAKREDYAVRVGDGALMNNNGLRLQRVWPWTYTRALDAEARFVSFQISSNGGICEVRSITFASASQRSDSEA